MDQKELQNQLRLFKLTKPELFRSAFLDTSSNLPANRIKPYHRQDMTDYFNYGFNEHTLQIYAHKITQLSEHYSQKIRKTYIQKCDQLEKTQPQNSTESHFVLAKQIKKFEREYYPIDLGGSYVPADDSLLSNIQLPTQNPSFLQTLLFDPTNTFTPSFNLMTTQYNCTSDKILYHSTLFKAFQIHFIKVIKQLNKTHKNLYMLEEAFKVFPDQRQFLQPQFDLLQVFNLQTPSLLSNLIPPKQHKKHKTPQSRSRSRTPKKKQHHNSRK